MSRSSSVADRDVDPVTLPCAGPRPVRYAFWTEKSTSTLAPEVLQDSITQVECDGAAHTDELRLPLRGGGRLFVTADSRNVWRIAVALPLPPIGPATNENGWTLAAGIGPDYETSGRASSVSLPGADNGGDTRGCDQLLRGWEHQRNDRGRGARERSGRSVHPGLQRRARGTPSPSHVDTRMPPARLTWATTRTGRRIWLAITVQVRAPGTPAP